MFTTIRSPPSLDEFVPLEEHQSHTPDTFFGGRIILHYHAVNAKAWIPDSSDGAPGLPIFPVDRTAPTDPEWSALGENGEVIEQEVELFVNSENLTIFNHKAECGVQIPYPSISIHATKNIGPEGNRVQVVWMQIELPEGDDDAEPLELTILPPPSDGSTSETNGQSAKSRAQLLYEAIATCSDLHPDPADEDEEDDDYNDRIIFEGSAEHEALEGFSGIMRGTADGGLPPPMPGSSGWITAENVHEYFDAEGNWIGNGEDTEELGEGAGRVRGRDEVEEMNGHEASNDAEAKRPRVDDT